MVADLVLRDLCLFRKGVACMVMGSRFRVRFGAGLRFCIWLACPCSGCRLLCGFGGAQGSGSSLGLRVSRALQV